MKIFIILLISLYANMAIAFEDAQSIIVLNHEEVRIVDINKLRNKGNTHIVPTLKSAHKFNFNTSLIPQYHFTKFEDIKKPVLKGYVKATDYLSEEQVVETSDMHDPNAIVYILKSDALKMQKRGYLWCTKQVSLWSDDIDHYVQALNSGNIPETLKEYNVRVLNLYTFSCNKENQKQITQDLTEWAELIVNAND